MQAFIRASYVARCTLDGQERVGLHAEGEGVATAGAKDGQRDGVETTELGPWLSGELTGRDWLTNWQPRAFFVDGSYQPDR